MDYQTFLATKTPSIPPAGFVAHVQNPHAYPFQIATVEWALHLGRAAIFADTGLGKTLMQLLWAHEVVRKTGGKVLLLTPLAVGAQTVREAGKFGIPDVRQIREAEDAKPGVNVCNYDRLGKMAMVSGWDGIILDESSILKSFAGSTRNALIALAQSIPYRLACTATPAPNDHTELGNHAEFLGVCTRQVMMARFFVNDLSDTVAPWRLKGWAVRPFWDWVASWGRCIGVPSDVGDYDDSGYLLPPLNVHTHTVAVDLASDRGDGHLFRKVDLSATAIHVEKRRTASERAEKVAHLIASEPDEPWVVWVDTDYDAEAVIAALPPSAFEVHGRMSSDEKADALLRFSDEGGMLVTKPKIAGFGMNWQHCARVIFAGGTYSYEAFYQAVRRCWRFGQQRPVDAHVVMAVTESAMWHVLHSKADRHDEMKAEMFAASRRAARSDGGATAYNPTHHASLPDWLTTK